MLLQGKKNIRAQHLDKKKYSFTGNIKEKKIPAARNFPAPPPPVTFLMVHPLLKPTAGQVKNGCQKSILNIIFAYKIFLLKENCNITIN